MHHAHCGRSDAVIEHHDIGLVRRQDTRELGRVGGVGDDVVAFAVEDEPQQTLLRRASLADHDTYTLRVHAFAVPLNTLMEAEPTPEHGSDDANN